MLELVVKRCLAAVPLLFLVSVFAFVLIKLLPGDPVDVLLGAAERDLSPAQVKLLRGEMGLDRPLYQQYLAWVAGWWGQGELGRSYRDGRPVLEVIGERLPATLALVGTALVIAFSLGALWGTLMAAARSWAFGRLAEPLMAGIAMFLYCAPNFWLAFVAVYVLIRLAPGLPILAVNAPGAGGGVSLLHLILPATVLSCRRLAKVALFLRAMIREEMGKDYVLVARSKGLGVPGVLIGHVLRNSILPVIGLLGISIPSLIGGSVLIETVFGWPGMGRLAVDATFARNYPVLLALVVTYGAMVIAGNLIADLLYALVDPRIRQAVGDKDERSRISLPETRK